MIKDYLINLVKDSFPVTYDTRAYCDLVLLDISSNKFGGLEGLALSGDVSCGFGLGSKFRKSVFPNSGKVYRNSSAQVKRPYIADNKPLNLHQIKK